MSHPCCGGEWEPTFRPESRKEKDPEHFRFSKRNGNASAAAGWLALAASPTFAIMALLTAIDGSADTICMAQGASPLVGMVPMYLLMSAFHSAPWLKLVSGLRRLP